VHLPVAVTLVEVVLARRLGQELVPLAPEAVPEVRLILVDGEARDQAGQVEGALDALDVPVGPIVFGQGCEPGRVCVVLRVQLARALHVAHGVLLVVLPAMKVQALAALAAVELAAGARPPVGQQHVEVAGQAFGPRLPGRARRPRHVVLGGLDGVIVQAQAQLAHDQPVGRAVPVGVAGLDECSVCLGRFRVVLQVE